MGDINDEDLDLLDLFDDDIESSKQSRDEPPQQVPSTPGRVPISSRHLGCCSLLVSHRERCT